MAAVIQKATGIAAEIVEGHRGEFTVWVGDCVVAKKDEDWGFPADEEILKAIQRALENPAADSGRRS